MPIKAVVSRTLAEETCAEYATHRDITGEAVEKTLTRLPPPPAPRSPSPAAPRTRRTDKSAHSHPAPTLDTVGAGRLPAHYLSYDETETWFLLSNPPHRYSANYAEKIAEHLISFLNTLPENLARAYAVRLIAQHRDQYSVYPTAARIAEHPKTKPCILAALGVEPDYTDVLYALAENPHTPPETLARLSHIVLIQEYVIQNPDTSTGTLQNLSENGPLRLRRFAAAALKKRVTAEKPNP